MIITPRQKTNIKHCDQDTTSVWRPLNNSLGNFSKKLSHVEWSHHGSYDQLKLLSNETSASVISFGLVLWLWWSQQLKWTKCATYEITSHEFIHNNYAYLCWHNYLWCWVVSVYIAQKVFGVKEYSFIDYSVIYSQIQKTLIVQPSGGNNLWRRQFVITQKFNSSHSAAQRKKHSWLDYSDCVYRMMYDKRYPEYMNHQRKISYGRRQWRWKEVRESCD